MATHSDVISKAVEGALEQIKIHAPEEYAKLEADPAKKEELIQAARAVATETVQLGEEFAGQPEDIAERLAKHLSKDRIKLIEGGLDIPTFRMDIKKTDGKHHAELFREDGTPFLPARALVTPVDFDWAKIMQYASILVEAVLLVMSAVGISISPSSKVMDETIEKTAEAIKTSPRLRQALDDFVTAWNAAGPGNAYEKAKAIFILIKECFAAGILWTIIKSLCSAMRWYDWLLVSAKVSAMIIAALATEGAALIAKIALIVLGAVGFARKIANIVQLSEIQKSL